MKKPSKEFVGKTDRNHTTPRNNVSGGNNIYMKHPTSKLPEHIVNAMHELSIIHDKLRQRGVRKPHATRMIVDRVKELVPNHSGSTISQFAYLAKREGLNKATELLRSSI